MVYISIGESCAVKYQIDKHKHKIETLFFDRLITSMKSVIEILSCNDINKILYYDNIIRDANNPIHQCNMSRILIKSLDKCISIHDINPEYIDSDIFEFIDKYKRRFNRIIEYIMSEEHIHFIRVGYVNTGDQEKFIQTILKINPNCKFTLVVIDNNKTNMPGISKYNKCLIIKLNIEEPLIFDWKRDYLNWESIFLDIENNMIN